MVALGFALDQPVKNPSNLSIRRHNLIQTHSGTLFPNVSSGHNVRISSDPQEQISYSRHRREYIIGEAPLRPGGGTPAKNKPLPVDLKKIRRIFRFDGLI